MPFYDGLQCNREHEAARNMRRTTHVCVIRVVHHVRLTRTGPLKGLINVLVPPCVLAQVCQTHGLGEFDMLVLAYYNS